jgi:hypoxanthine-DNA glycosylase
MAKEEHIIHPLKPFYRSDSEILILGSFPSVKTRESGFFYGHPQNRFWKVLAELFDEAEPGNIPEKESLLVRHKIALYDVIKECDIRGSADSSIRNAKPTDLKSIIENSSIRTIFCNGQLSGKMFRLYQEPILKQEAIVLPSTSPANASWTLPKLVEAWSVISIDSTLSNL